MVVPQNGWFIDDFGVPLFSETPMLLIYGGKIPPFPISKDRVFGRMARLRILRTSSFMRVQIGSFPPPR